MKYYTELNRPRPGEHALMLRTERDVYYCRWHVTYPGFGAQNRLRLRVGADAVHTLWKMVRGKEPEAFARAVELGWIKAPNDCPKCHGRGHTVERVVDEFRQALQWGHYNRLTAEAPAAPTMLAKVHCEVCAGRGWK